MARNRDNSGCSLTRRSRAARGRAHRPRTARSCHESHRRRTPGFARRDGPRGRSASGIGFVIGGDWASFVRLAGIGFVRRVALAIPSARRPGPAVAGRSEAHRRSAAPSRTEPHRGERKAYARVRSAPRLRFARRGAPGPLGVSTGRARAVRGPVPRPRGRAKPHRGESSGRRTLGFARRRLGSLKAEPRVGSADRSAARHPIPGRKRTRSPRTSTEQDRLRFEALEDGP